MEQNNDRNVIRGMLPTIPFQKMSEIFSLFGRQTLDRYSDCECAYEEFDLRIRVTREAVIDGTITAISGVNLLVYLEDVIAEDVTTSEYDPLRQWAKDAVYFKNNPKPKPLFKEGDLVEVRICKGLSGVYWSLCGMIREVGTSYASGRWQGTPYLHARGFEYTVEFSGQRYDEARATDREMCARMTLHEQMLKPLSAPVDVGARIKSYLGDTLVEARPPRTDAPALEELFDKLQK